MQEVRGSNPLSSTKLFRTCGDAKVPIGARFGRLAAVRIEGSDGVRYEALMDPRDVGLINSEVDLVYLTESDLYNTPDPGHVMAQARPRTLAYLSYHPAFAFAKAVGSAFTGMFLFGH